MYRYGDGTPFPLEENFIETLTSAVEACTNAFMPLTELDERRNRAKAARVEADGELNRLADLEKTLGSALAPYMVPEKKSAQALQVAQKTLIAAKQTIQAAKQQVESRVSALEAQAAAATSSEAVLQGLRPFFDHNQLPNAKWIMSWDVRGNEPSADSVMTAGRLIANFRLQVEAYRHPIRVEQIADGVVVHMMKKGLLGKAKPAPVDLGKYVMVAFERTQNESVITLREKPDRQSQGLRLTVGEHTATWQSLTPNGDAETEANPLDGEDFAGIRRLGEGAQKALKDLTSSRTLTDLTLGGQPLSQLPEPRVVPMEVLQQLTPLARTIRERSRMSGELVLKKDVGGGRREELFVPRAQLSQHFAKLPMDYRKPFEEMGISGEDTQPAIQLPANLRPPAKVDKNDKPIPPPPPPAHSHAKVDPDKTLVAPPVIIDDSLKEK